MELLLEILTSKVFSLISKMLKLNLKTHDRYLKIGKPQCLPIYYCHIIARYPFYTTLVWVKKSIQKMATELWRQYADISHVEVEAQKGK